jgi:hypothetical protein
MLRTWLASTHSGAQEVLGLALLYGAYEVVRGFGSEDVSAALDHTGSIVALEQHLGVFVERRVQEAVEGIAGLPALLGALYVLLHFVGTAIAIIWVHRRHRDAYPVVRTTLIAATALGLVGYVLFPAAPPRLAGLGFVDTVTSSTGLNLSSDLLGSLYNPFAAVPSLHFGYSLIVGLAIATLAHNPVVRIAGALYPALMLFVIVATGNHFLFDAFAGGAVVVVAWALARAATSRRSVERSSALSARTA